MKKISAVSLILLGIIILSCSSNDPVATTSVALKMSATTANGKSSFGGRLSSSSGRANSTPVVSLTDVTVNIRDIRFEYDHEDHHFEKDSSFHCNGDSTHRHHGGDHKPNDDSQKLIGPFIVSLMNAGTFVDQVVTTVSVPNAQYERIGFKLSPREETGEMNGKSIEIKGSINDTPFVF